MKKWILFLLFSTTLFAQDDEEWCFDEYFVTPSSRVCECFVGLSFTGDYLYWEATFDCLNTWTSGYRVGLAYDFCYDEWSLKGSWTSLDFCSSLWELKFNALDVDLGRQYFLSDTFEVFPQFGLKAIWLDQEFTDFVIQPVIGTFKTRSEFWGIGPKLALLGKWNWACRFGPYGKVGGALLWGEFKNQEQKTHLFFALEDIIATKKIPKKSRIRPMLEIQVGLDWTSCFCNWFFFDFKVAFEAEYFWRQNTIFADTDIDFKGLVVSGSVGF